MPEARTRNWRHELLIGSTGGLLDQGKVQVTASFAPAAEGASAQLEPREVRHQCSDNNKPLMRISRNLEGARHPGRYANAAPWVTAGSGDHPDPSRPRPRDAALLRVTEVAARLLPL